MPTQTIEYTDGKVTLEGYIAYKNDGPAKKPLVLIVHDWTGRNDFVGHKAEKLAELGYVGFALDMFGKGVLGTTKEEKAALIQPFFADRNLLQKRMLAGFDAARKLDMVDGARIGAMGFCFGGLCVLDLARSGADVRGVVSFHGLLISPPGEQKVAIKAKVLALHGHDDPMVQPDQVLAFEHEMTTAKVDWQVHVYGNTMHSFTNPEANDPGFGTVFSDLANKRSWQTMQNFFAEAFS